MGPSPDGVASAASVSDARRMKDRWMDAPRAGCNGLLQPRPGKGHACTYISLAVLTSRPAPLNASPIPSPHDRHMPCDCFRRVTAGKASQSCPSTNARLARDRNEDDGEENEWITYLTGGASRGWWRPPRTSRRWLRPSPLRPQHPSMPSHSQAHGASHRRQSERESLGQHRWCVPWGSCRDDGSEGQKTGSRALMDPWPLHHHWAARGVMPHAPASPVHAGEHGNAEGGVGAGGAAAWGGSSFSWGDW